MTRIPAWIVHAGMHERSYEGSELVTALQSTGTKHWVLDYGLNTPLEVPEECDSHHYHLMVWGSLEFVRELRKKISGTLLLYGHTERTHWFSCVSNLSDLPFLSDDAFGLPWGVFKRSAERLRGCYGGERVFVRPNSGFKTFTGQTIGYDSWEEDVRSIEQTSSVMDETLVVTASAKEILGEFRFVVVDGRVVAGSEYRWDGKLDVRRDWPAECEGLAQRVAEHPWQLDSAYVVDVADTPDGPHIVELNSFCHAGLYASDVEAIVRAVNAVAEKEDE